MFSILSWGGIGDTLHNIGLVPHEWLHRHAGIRCRVFRRPQLPGENACPPTSFFRDMVERSPSLQWGGEITEQPRWQRAPTRAVREVANLFHSQKPRYFPFNFHLTREERAALPRRPAGPVIGLQPHLSGIAEKAWGSANWRAYLNRMLAESDASFILIEPDEKVTELCFDPRIQNTRGLNISQSIAVVSQVDLLVSVDSWTKYVAASVNIPQVVVVPSQAPYHSPEYLARSSFEGIFGRPQNLLIGLTGTRRAPQTTLPTMSDLTPAMLVEATLSLMARHLQR